MMHRIAIALGLALVVSACAANHARPPDAAKIERALSLRAQLGAATGLTPHAVIVHSERYHFAHGELATLATRDEDGIWTLASIGEEARVFGPGVETIPARVRVLPRETGKRLDALFAAPTTFNEKIRTTGEIAAGDATHTMEIRTPGRRKIVAWTGRLAGSTGQIADIVLGRGRR
jgi:hypothetical protein